MTDDRDGQPPGGLDADAVAALLRGEATAAPTSVTTRAVARVRVESTATVLLRTLAGGWLRVARAAGDLAAPPPLRSHPVDGTGRALHDDVDTGELDQHGG